MNALSLTLSKITPDMTASQRATVLVTSLRYCGVDLRKHPPLEEVKQLLTKVLRA